MTSLLADLPAAEQAEWVEELRSRLHVAGPAAPVACVLDAGVQDGHPPLVMPGPAAPFGT